MENKEEAAVKDKEYLDSLSFEKLIDELIERVQSVENAESPYPGETGTYFDRAEAERDRAKAALLARKPRAMQHIEIPPQMIEEFKTFKSKNELLDGLVNQYYNMRIFGSDQKEKMAASEEYERLRETVLDRMK